MIKLLATGDLHLGRSSTQLPADADEYPVSKVWNRIVAKAIELKVDVVLLSGDVIDRENRYYATINELKSGLSQLVAENIPVFMVSGNHDFNVLPDVLIEQFANQVHLLGKGGKWEVKTFAVNGMEIQIAGWSFLSEHIYHSPLGDFPKNQINPAIPVVGLLHGEAGVSDSRYAPLDLAQLQTAGPQLWVLGHIHKQLLLSEHGSQVWYPGSPQALSPKEQDAHGPLLIEIHSKNDIRVETILLSPVRYDDFLVNLSDKDVSGIRTAIQDAIKDFNDELPQDHGAEYVVLDLHLTGVHSDPVKMMDELTELPGHVISTLDGVQFSVRKVVNQLKPAVSNLEQLAEQRSPAGMLAQSILALENATRTPLLDIMEQQWEEGFRKVMEGGAYSALVNRGKDQPYFDEQKQRREEFLLSVCRQLLSELVQQQKSASL